MSEGLTIKRPVIVKVKVSEYFKKEMGIELQEALTKVDTELQHLDFQLKRMLIELDKRNPTGIPSARQQMEAERQKRLQAKASLTEQLNSLEKLAIGSEVTQGTLESLVEINVGDDWREVMGVEIVIHDNNIIDIRRRKYEQNEA